MCIDQDFLLSHSGRSGGIIYVLNLSARVMGIMKRGLINWDVLQFKLLS